MRDTGVAHKYYSSKFKNFYRLSVSLNQLGLRSDEGVVRRGGELERKKGGE